MALNVERIRKQVQKAIEVAPFNISLKRHIKESDGRGGEIDTGKVVDAFNGICLFDNSGDGPFSLVQSEAGRQQTQGGNTVGGPYLIVVYETDDQVRVNDYFEYGGSRFEVTKVTNVLTLNIYWKVQLKETKL